MEIIAEVKEKYHLQFILWSEVKIETELEKNKNESILATSFIFY